MRAWGKIGSIVECEEPLPLHTPDAFSRALSFHWEFMFTKGMHGIELESQGRILAQLAQLAVEGKLESVVTKREVLSVESLSKMHEHLESGKAIGKVVFDVPDKLQ